jgi:hypothetical protein
VQHNSAKATATYVKRAQAIRDVGDDLNLAKIVELIDDKCGMFMARIEAE